MSLQNSGAPLTGGPMSLQIRWSHGPASSGHQVVPWACKLAIYLARTFFSSTYSNSSTFLRKFSFGRSLSIESPGTSCDMRTVTCETRSLNRLTQRSLIRINDDELVTSSSRVCSRRRWVSGSGMAPRLEEDAGSGESLLAGRPAGGVAPPRRCGGIRSSARPDVLTHLRRSAACSVVHAAERRSSPRQFCRSSYVSTGCRRRRWKDGL